MLCHIESYTCFRYSGKIFIAKFFTIYIYFEVTLACAVPCNTNVDIFDFDKLYIDICVGIDRRDFKGLRRFAAASCRVQRVAVCIPALHRISRFRFGRQLDSGRFLKRLA